LTRTVAILAGGLGTRVAALTGGAIPKAMLPVAGAPFIDHKLEEARRLGASRVVLLLGHAAGQIVEHVGDGARFGVPVTVVLDGDELLGTGGALRQAAASLGDRPWITYGDTLLEVDLDAAERQADAAGCRGVMTVLRNRDQLEPSNTTVVANRVTAYSKGDPPGTHEYIDYGLVRLPTAAFEAVGARAFDLSVIVQDLIGARDLAAFEVHEPFHDIGTPESRSETNAWLRSGKAWLRQGKTDAP
jgi:NDP-sugar pyrophosphorylase family protein